MSSSMFIAIAFLACYFIPTGAARKRDRPMIFVINLFLGWTVIGWVVALAMALRPAPKDAA